MRRILLPLVLFGLTVPVVAQTPTPQSSIMLIMLPLQSAKQTGAILWADQTQMGLEPAVSLPAEALEAGAAIGVSKIGFRAWKESDKARVVVYAILTDTRSPTGMTETPISTFLIGSGEWVTVQETKAWGVSPVIVGSPAVQRFPRVGR